MDKTLMAVDSVSFHVYSSYSSLDLLPLYLLLRYSTVAFIANVSLIYSCIYSSYHTALQLHLQLLAQ